MRWRTFCLLLLASNPAFAADQHGREMLEALAAQPAKAHGVPAGLVHRVIMRESRYIPRAVSRGTMALCKFVTRQRAEWATTDQRAAYSTRISISPTQCPTSQTPTALRVATRIVRS